jgi:hypothetical protein
MSLRPRRRRMKGGGKEALVAAAAEHHAQCVHVHETPHELRVEIELPDGEPPQFIFAVTRRGLELRVFRPFELETTWHSNTDAVPT